MPLLDGKPAAEKQLLQSEINGKIAETIRRFHQGDKRLIEEVLCTAWSLVLRFYAGQDHVTFRLVKSEETQQPAGDSSNEQGSHTLSFKFEEDKTLASCLTKTQDFRAVSRINTAHTVDAGIAPIDDTNTAIFFYSVTDDENTNARPLFDTQNARSLCSKVMTYNTSFREILKLTINQENLWVKATFSPTKLQLQLHGWNTAVSLGYLNSVTGSLEAILLQLTSTPHTQIANLNYFSPRHQKQLDSWNVEPADHLQTCVAGEIYTQVLAHPEREAVCAWDGTFTYRELWLHAQYLAERLIEIGAGPEDIIALAFEKTKWCIVAMLAVMETGAAFCPLDGSQPPQRLERLASRLGAKITLCSKKYEQKFANLTNNVMSVDGSTFRPDQTNLQKQHRAQPSNAVYVLWTSGSTGDPKAIVIENGTYCSAAAEHAKALHMRATSRVLQFGHYVFDASIIETLTVLIVGATICVPSEEFRLNGLADAMNQMKVSWTCLTPSVANFIGPQDVPHLKTLILMGEVMSDDHLSRWSSIDLLNAYGPAECSVAATVNEHLPVNRQLTKIGRGIGVRCWLVDPENDNCLVPPGCSGELLLEGPSLARCYLGDPEKTQQAFITDPPWAGSGGRRRKRRMYKTGDLVRQDTTDGLLYFVGRKDSQVKVHGQRVELGEIEHHLSQEKAYEQSIVLLPKEGLCKGRLVAVVALDDQLATETLVKDQELQFATADAQANFEPALDTVRANLSRRLPAFMLPSIWLLAVTIPFLRSGKIDRKRVLKTVQNISGEQFSQWFSTKGDDSSVASEIESQLQSIWGEVLNLKASKIGFSSSFVSLGGDSISAMMVQSSLKKINLGTTVDDIISAKSIRQLAKSVRTADSIKVAEEKIEEEFDLSPIQALFFQQPGQGEGHFNQSFFLRLTRTMKADLIHQAIKTIVNRHSMLRARFRVSEFDEEWKQRITLDVAGSYRFKVQQCSSKEDAIPFMGKTQASLNPEVGPLFATDLFELPDGSQLLFMTGHHLVIDLVSWRVILQDLEDFLTNPDFASKPERLLSFQSWCKLQDEHASKAPLKSVLPTAKLPKHDGAFWGMQNKPNLYGDVLCKGFEIEPTTTSWITSKAHDTMRTDIVDILTSSMLHSFSQVFTDRECPSVYNEGHGREVWDRSIDLSRTVGWFTTMYPICCSEVESGSFIDTLRQVKDYRRTVPANGRPYFASRMLTKGGSRRFGSHWPLELTFNYLGIYQQLERENALLQPAEEMAGEARGAGGKADVGERAPRFGLFEISAVIVQGKLRFSFTFNRHMKHQDRIASWIEKCRDTLLSIPQVFSQVAHRPTLSDYPLLRTDYENLDRFVNERLPELGLSDIGKVEDIYQCSQIQQGLLISTQKDAGAYAVHGIYEAKARSGHNINTDKLAVAWQQVVDRHPSLRTIFVEGLSHGDALYVQLVLKSFDADVVRLQAPDKDTAIKALADLPQITLVVSEPAHRLAICSTAQGTVYCRVDLSHTIMDGASMSIIFRDLVLLYDDLTLQGSTPLYSHYIAFLRGLSPEAGIGYWKSYLADTEPCCFPILTDNAGEVVRELRSKRFRLELANLQTFCHVHDVTLANLFHIAWALTLRCYTGSKDVVFGYLTSTRDSAVENIENMVGYLVNMLLCRVTFTQGSSLIGIMKRIQSDLSQNQNHRQTALADVLHSLNVSGSTLFDTSLSYRKLPLPEKTQQTAITIEDCCPYYDPTEYGVSINIEATEEIAAIDLDYWTDALSDGNATNVMNTFLSSIEHILSDASVAAEQVDWMSSSDQQTISKWNAHMPPTMNRCVHEVIKEEAILRPSAEAVCGWDATFTYAELDAIAERLAAYLRLLNVGPEVICCLCFEKSAYTIVGMLGVLKAGGAFCALDPMHPMAALDLRIKDTKTKVILASPCYTSMFDGMGLDVLPIDGAFLGKLPSLQNALKLSASPDNPCCVIYTSGSTGRPKGVVIEHKALVTSSNAHGSALGIGRNSRFLQFSSYTFDNNLEEIFTSLMRGAVVCVPSDHDRLNNLAGAATRLQANFMDLTPTVATYLDPSEMPTIKGMALGGEALTKTVLDVWGGKVQIHNQYGPSECTINSTHRTDIHKSSDPSSIGRSVGSVSWITDPMDHNRLQPIGCEGELLIEGPILARGYLNNPEKTAGVFIENPDWTSNAMFKTDSNASPRRMYKTGDLVRYNSDGTINYLGRKDQQVKLNGQRIELGEIEFHTRNALDASWHFAIELITPGSITGAAKTLAAFVCPQEDRNASATTPRHGLLPVSTLLLAAFKDLESSLVRALPKHMVPSMYIAIENLPLTSSGKLDRKQLHSIAKAMTENQISMYRLSAGSGREPSTDMEKTLAHLWETILKLEQGSLGVDAQFFRMGGDSIAAIRLVTAVRAEGISLSVAKIFQSNTLADMAKTTERSKISEEVSPSAPAPFSLLPEAFPSDRVIDEAATICAVSRDSIEDVYPCTAIQEGLVALSTKQPGAYVATNIYRLKSVDLPRFKKAWDTVVSEESVLRTRVMYTESLGFLQVVVREPINWLEIAAPPNQDAEGLSEYSKNGARMTGFQIAQESPNEAFFVWTIHHALFDGWSIQLLLSKVHSYYSNLTKAKPNEPAAFSTFMKYVLQEGTAQSESFWQSNLAGPMSPTFPPLPSLAYQPHVTNSTSSRVSLPRRGSSRFTMPFMIRAAWALTLARYANSEDVIFAETIANRDAPVTRITDIIGPTFATVPVRVQGKGDSSLQDYLERLQKDFLDAMPHQNLGLQRIKRLNRECAKACEFQNLIAINTDGPSEDDQFWEPTTNGTAGSNFFTYALTISFDVGASEVRVTAHHDPKVLPKWQLQRLLGFFGSVLGHICAPQGLSKTVESLGRIPPEDIGTIQSWNTQTPERVDRCVHEIIQERARTISKARPAIEGWDAALTYQELDRVSSSLASHLFKFGVTRGSFIPICFEKSALTIIVMLAIMKAGAAFVALDGDSPQSRLENITADVEASLIVCSAKHVNVCKTLASRLLVLDLETISKMPYRSSPISISESQDIAYVIFTSGSTGKPKGTLVSHAAFASGATAHGPAMGMSSESRVLQFSSYTFDASIMEIFTTLILGGCICVPDDHTRLNDVSKAIEALRANWTLLTPSFAQNVIPTEVPSLKTLVLGGEAMSDKHIETWTSHVQLVNAYGPSECAVVATVQAHVSLSAKAANIGTAVGSQAFIVNSSNHHELTPIGAVGELVLSGPTLARGYLKNPVKTQEAFVQAPAWMQFFRPSAISSANLMYKTGDLVKYTEDGSLIFMGRKDTQAKFHGQRLELGEIEHFLAQVPILKHGVATMPVRGLYEKKLVGVISAKQQLPSLHENEGLSPVNRQDAAHVIQEAQEYLSAQLPPYMVPSSWIVLQSLPLLPSGKLDRRRVTSWVEDIDEILYRAIAGSMDDGSLDQGSEVEERIRQIWSQVLRLSPQQISLDKNFIFHGGDSISAMQVSALGRKDGLGISVQDIIRCKSIHHLASGVTLPKAAIAVKEEVEHSFSLSPMQRLFFDWVGDKHNHFNQSVAISLQRRKTTAEIKAALEVLASAHSMLRARFEQDGKGIWQQRIDRDSSRSLTFNVHKSVQNHDQIRDIVASAQAGLDIRKGPLVSANLFESGQNRGQVLSLVMHHLIVDVVSWGIILQDLEDLFESKRPMQPSIPFQIWCKMQEERLPLDSKIDHLDQIVAPDYDFWHMSNKRTTYAPVKTYTVNVDATTTKRLLGPCNRALQSEITDVLLATLLHAFNTAFPERQSPPTIFNEAHGRQCWDADIDTTHTVGWFTTISPIYLPAEARHEPSLAHIVRWIKDLRSRNLEKGRQYFAQRMLTEAGRSRFHDHWPIEIAFNYLGQEKAFQKSGSVFEALDRLTSDSDVGPSVPRFALIEVTASIANDELQTHFSFHADMGRQTALKAWTEQYEKSLWLAAATLPDIIAETTLSDFALAPLAYNTIEKIQQQIVPKGIPSIADLEDIYECSSMQQGILISQIKNADQYMYQTTFTVKPSPSESSVDGNKLATAWRKVVQQHSPLRTVFINSLSKEGSMDQVILKKVSPRIIRLQDQLDAIDYLQRQKCITFKDEQPYHRLSICESSDGTVVCKIEISHALCDGTSVPLLLRDLAKFYASESILAQPSAVYRDYISFLRGNSAEESSAFWRKYLESAETCHLPVLSGSKIESKLCTLALDLENTSGLREFCTQNGVTLSTTLQLVWSLVLRTFTGSNHVCFGYLSSGRDVPVDGIEDAVGLFISMLICRIDCSDERLVTDALGQIRDDHAQSMAHQGSSLGDLQHETGVSGRSLFNTAFTFQRRPEAEKETDETLRYEVHEAYDPSEYDFTINVESCGDAVEVLFNYWTSHVSAQQAHIISETFAQIVESITKSTNPSQKIGQVELCGGKQRQQIYDWNKKILPLVDSCVHDLIYQQSQTLPMTAPAITSWDAELTYIKLMSLSKRLSKHLTARGARPGTYVALCFEKSSWAVVAMLGVLMSGAAFVPIEASHPENRIKFIISNIGAKLVLCSPRYTEKFASYEGVKAIAVDDTLIQQPIPRSEGPINPPMTTDPAYLIFTSGTTGLPKGTIISHRAFSTSASEHAPAILMRQHSRVLQFSNLCFDASIMEILTSLITGACVCIPSEEERMNNIPGAISRMSVNWTLLTPSVANVLKPEACSSLKVLVTGGEAMQARHIAKWRDSTSLVNAYGPSECAVIATTSIKVDEQRSLIDDDPTIIGEPVGCRGWIVDANDHTKLMPIGSVGELVLEGNTLANGYLNNEEKTAKAFVPCPDWMIAQSTESNNGQPKLMYKTGDLVRYNSVGQIIYCTRKDTQIKLNGLRIELGEIEYHVKKNLPETIASAVAMVAPAGQESAIATFFVPQHQEVKKADAEDSNEETTILPITENDAMLFKTLKKELANGLPSYMIPSLYIPISRIPWTTSGKLDSLQLKKMIAKMSKEDVVPFKLARSGQKRAPATDIQKTLASIWESILSLAPSSVSIDDSFFVVGGDSVQAMKLVAAARAEGLLISTLDIFRKPMLWEMAEATTPLENEEETVMRPFGMLRSEESIEQLLEEVTTQCRVDKKNVADAYPCSALQEGLITSSIKQPGAYVNQTLFRLPEALDLDQFKSAWQAAVEEIDILRTRILHTASSEFLQIVLKQEDLEWYSANSREQAMGFSARIPEGNGSKLMNFAVIDSPDGREFLLSMHHALYDGWSLPKMLQRVEELYFEDESALPKVSFSQFMHYITKVDGQACSQFWKSKFGGLETVHFPKSLTAAADQGTTDTLKFTLNLPPRPSGTGITLPTMIRAAWAMVLFSHTGSQDVVFGEVLTGRDVPVEGIIDVLGPTLTTVPTRVRKDDESTVTQYLQGLSRMAADVIPYQHVGLQHIRRISPETSLASSFQNLLVIQTAGDGGESKMWDPISDGVGANFFTYPLVVECNTADSSIHIDAHYDKNTISVWHVQVLLQQLESVLGRLCTEPADSGTKLADIEILSNHDIQAMKKWNSHELTVVEDCIHDLFRKQADTTPTRQAVFAWDGAFSYQELRQQATTLSYHLISSGVGRGSLVPFCMDKSRWAVVAQLAILISGAAMVPLDPAHPVSRHAEIIKDSGAEYLLCTPHYQGRYAEVVKFVIPVSEEHILKPRIGTKSKRPSTLVRRQSESTSPHDPAYVIFTSGSTGKPKGVVVEHRAFCSSSKAYCEAMLMDPQSRVFNFASVTFDVGLMENMSPLTMGACVCVPNNESKMANLGASIDGLKATWAFLTPSVANLIEPSSVPSLKVLVCGGEAMSQENISKWADELTLVNGYGPTEASVIALVNQNVSKERDAGSIGRPHAAGYAWVTDVDDYNRLTPLGCTGELVLEGPLLAREYLHDEQKTANAFVVNPRWARSQTGNKDPTRRFYRTGDLAKFNPDGTVAFFGRKDNQVKLHGQRIELGEIEHTFEVNPHIRHAVAVVPKSGLCKKRLVGVFSMTEFCQESKASAATRCNLLGSGEMEPAQAKLTEVKNTVSNHLPPYMMPALYFIVEAIPLLVSGKLDRKQVEKWLLDLDEATYNKVTNEEQDMSAGAPITETVQMLREIWAAVFNIPVDAVNPNQSFISQGGDSLISMSIISRCRKQGITLSLQEILQSKSLHQVATIVDSRGGGSQTKKFAASAEKLGEPFELSPVQQLYFELKGSSEDHTKEGRFNQSQVLGLRQRVDPDKVQQAIEVLVQQHSMFRARFSKSNTGQWQQRIVDDVKSSYSFKAHRVQQLNDMVSIQSSSQKSLNIETGPLFATALVDSSKDGQVVSLIAHHLVIDVVSWNVLLQQFEELLTGAITSIEKPLSYQIWTKLQKDHANSREPKQVKSILPFRTKRADIAFWSMSQRKNLYGDVKHHNFTLDKATTHLLIGNANKALRTQPLDIFMASLISSFAVTFPQRSSPTIFNESHGRDVWDVELDITGTTGWFTSLFPLNVPDDNSRSDPVEVLKWTKDLRRSLPSNGREYFAHRYLTPDGKWRFGDHVPMEILLNYTGQAQQGQSKDSFFAPVSLTNSEAEERAIADVGPETARMALFEISIGISGGITQFSFMYNKHMKYQEGIQTWIAKCQYTAKELITRLSTLAAQPTLSDYPLLPTTYSGLTKHVTDTFREVGVSSLDEVEDIYICAPTQEGLLLSQIRNPGQYINYVISEAKLASTGSRIDVPRLVKAWQKVVDRHQSLRTAFVYSVCKGHAFDQIAFKRANGGAKVIQCADDRFEEEFAKISLKEINKTRRPQMPHQLSICSTKSGRCYIKLELNHAVIDGGSGALITRDLALAYEGRLPGDPKPLYSDYVRFINTRSEDGGDIVFWKQYLQGVQRCYLQKLDPAPSTDKRLNAIYLHFDRFPELGEFCRANGITLSNVMLAAWGLVLRQYTGRDDVCFGNLTAGRDAPVDGIQDTVGAFINMLVCRVQFKGSTNLGDLVRQMQSDYLGMLPHQHCSLAKLQHDLGFSGEALFNTAVSIQNQISTRDAEKEGDAIEFDPLTDYDPTEVSKDSFTNFLNRSTNAMV